MTLIMSDKEEKPKDKGGIFEKIEEFTKQGHQLLQNGDVLNSYSAYEKAVELAEKTDEGFTIRACLFNLGACCVANGEASKGLQFLLRAVPPQKESDGSLNFADLHYNLAVAYDILGKANEAKKCYETSLEGYKSTANLEMQGEVLLKLGGTLTTLNMFKEAADVFEHGEKIFQELLDKRHEVLCLSSRATLLAEMQDETCQDLLKIVVERVEDLKTDLLKAKVYSDIGLVYTSSGYFNEAAEYLNKSLNFIQSTDGDQKLQASVCQNLGAIHNQIGSFVKATIYHEKAIELYGLLGMRYAQGHAFSNLGFAFGQLGDLEKSGEYFMHALQAAKDSQDSRGQWQANEGLSAVYFQKKDYAKAVSCLKATLTMLTFGGVKDETVHERIVAKLSNALEYQLISNKPTEMQTKSVIMMENAAVSESTDGDASQKIGQTRPREKNHKFVARGLDLDGQDVEDTLSDSTFDSITSYSGSSLSIDKKDSQDHEMDEKENIIKPESNKVPIKKDPLNNTYEEPQDIINVLNTGGLGLQNIQGNEQLHDQQPQTTEQPKTNTKSRTCVIQ